MVTAMTSQNPPEGRPCRGCGRRDGTHDVYCLAARRAEVEKLQAECDHHAETVTRTTGDPPGPWCCGRCGIELADQKEDA